MKPKLWLVIGSGKRLSVCGPSYVPSNINEEAAELKLIDRFHLHLTTACPTKSSTFSSSFFITPTLRRCERASEEKVSELTRSGTLRHLASPRCGDTDISE